MQEIKAPNAIAPQAGFKTLFLAGSIEMGAAENWQEQVRRLMATRRVCLLNPRRDDWDSSWVQSGDNAQFREQVEWELAAQERADHILMYFEPGTKSPISLLELGLFARSGKMRVVCPAGFWKKGNVDVVCERYGVRRFSTIEEAVNDFL